MVQHFNMHLLPIESAYKHQRQLTRKTETYKLNLQVGDTSTVTFPFEALFKWHDQQGQTQNHAPWTSSDTKLDLASSSLKQNPPKRENTIKIRGNCLLIKQNNQDTFP